MDINREEIRNKVYGYCKSGINFTVRAFFPGLYILAAIGSLFYYGESIGGSKTILTDLSMISFTVGMFVLIFGTEMKRIVNETEYFVRSVKISLGFLIVGAFFLLLMLSTPIIAEFEPNSSNIDSAIPVIGEEINYIGNLLLGFLFIGLVSVPTIGLGLSIWLLLKMLADLIFDDFDATISESEN